MNQLNLTELDSGTAKVTLVVYEAACRAVEEAATVDEAKEFHDEYKAREAYARQAKNFKLEADCWEIRVKATRRINELVKAQDATVGLNRGTAGKGRPKLGGVSDTPPKDDRPTLGEAKIDKNLAKASRKLGKMDESSFKTFVTNGRNTITGKEGGTRQRRNVLGYTGSLTAGKDRDGDSWFTPAMYLDKAREVLRSIDLDPYSSKDANAVIRAKHFFTLQRRAPSAEKWPEVETCWMNPPYSGDIVFDAVNRFCDAFDLGKFCRGIVLVNNATETRFFQRLLATACAVCLTDHRIAFENKDGKRISGNTRGQAFLYFDRNNEPSVFARAFGEFGAVLGCGANLLGGGDAK
jgi:hypothetical protein